MVTFPGTLIETSSVGPGTMPVLQLPGTSQNPPEELIQVIVGVVRGVILICADEVAAAGAAAVRAVGPTGAVGGEYAGESGKSNRRVGAGAAVVPLSMNRRSNGSISDGNLTSNSR